MGQKITRWIVEHLLWDAAGAASHGLRRGLWATRKLLLAFAGAALLTWREWVEHRPPEIAIVAVMHFVVVLAVIWMLVLAAQGLARAFKKPVGQ